MEQRLPLCLVRQGVKFDKRYVSLFDDPITLTDQDDTPGKTRQLKRNYAGWTAKMELFAPWNQDLRPCLFFDLDTYVLGNIDDIYANSGDELWLISDFFFPERSNSGIMIIPKDTNDIWEQFQHQNPVNFRDGDFLTKFPHRVLQEQYGGIKSYKKDNLYEKPSGRIVCFHGYPKPHETKGWAKDIWTSSLKPSQTLQSI